MAKDAMTEDRVAEPADDAEINDALMIGALLSVPLQALSRRISAALTERGFTDWRQTNRPIFMWCKPGGSRLTELAKRAGITKQSMGELIDSLEHRGYVERIPDPTDARATLIRRTTRGWDLTQLICRVVEDVQREWAQALGQERFDALMNTLRQLTIILDEPH